MIKLHIFHYKKIKKNKKKQKKNEEKLKKLENNNSQISSELEEKNRANEQLNKENKSLKENEINFKEKINEYSKTLKEKEKIIYDLSEFKNQVEESEKNIVLLSDIEKKEKEIEMKAKEFQKDKQENERIKKENEMLIKKKEEIEKQIKEKQPLLRFIEIKSLKEPILIGLNNIGATCFMNSTLQCLSQTKYLSLFFLNPKNENLIQNNNIAIKNKNENTNDLQLSPVFSDLIKKLWDIEGPKSFSPTDFRKRVEQMNPLFRQGQPGDSKDFIIFILEQIHKELKRPNKNIKVPNNKLDQYNKQNSLEHFFS